MTEPRTTDLPDDRPSSRRRDSRHESARPPTLDEIDRLRVVGRRPLTQEMLDRARGEGRP
ncbi:MAG TPA: hypothetical protein VKU40_16090 [Thermoanaerobaculia bacterium]|nr:hypothetical protein [Thermoanaerobaculia bacterium]